MDCEQGREIMNELARKAKNCKVDGCASKLKAWGLCSNHYKKWRRDNEEVIRVMGGKYDEVKPELNNPEPDVGESVNEEQERQDHEAPPEYEQKKAQEGVSEKLAREHWDYLESLLQSELSGQDHLNEYVRRVGFHFRSAMIHGFKHGVEYASEAANAPEAIAAGD
jgi:hypothetical protein